MMSMGALQEVGMRGVVYQESFGPDARLANENFEKLKAKLEELQTIQTATRARRCFASCAVHGLWAATRD